MSRPPVNPAQPTSGHDGNGESDRPGPGNVGSFRPRGILIISIVVVLEATALLAAAAWYGFELLTGAPVLTFWGAVFTLVLLLAFSAWLFAVGHFLFRGYRWTRAAALVAQLFVLTIGFPTMTGGLVLPGLAMILPALAAIIFLFQRDVISFASRTGGSTGAL
ncbi:MULTISPECIES: hypothetical protein [Paenarthrobacter]|uniref:hypothetical protein n=1 Tax=Paenarthrobacter TaxID=1742992 RepID=UPI002365339A|nr:MULTISPECIES: hypothetical protein [Paenarthrobacter]MDD7834760.1 hypothetical protein [Paenarthrobacter sp. AB444]MDP9935272.1 phosphoglycerol transferase MdoB-like AlkP superfamily enzyme [Paenarthrobacter nicotinovorans]